MAHIDKEIKKAIACLTTEEFSRLYIQAKQEYEQDNRQMTTAEIRHAVRQDMKNIKPV